MCELGRTVGFAVRPAEVLIGGLPVPLPDGLNGEVVCMRSCLAQGGVEITDSAAFAVTGAAFRAVFYRRGDNPGDPHAHDWCWSSETLVSRDPHRALAEYVGAVVEVHPDLDPDAAWILVQAELAEGRPVISYGIGGPFEPVLLSGYRKIADPANLTADPRSGRRLLRVQSKFLPARDAEIEVTGRTNWCGEGAHDRNYAICVRPRAAPAPDAARKVALRLDALRWAVRHARAGVERLGPRQKVYRTGFEAYEAFADFLTAPHGAEREIATSGPRERGILATFVASIANELRRARHAAALFFEEWAFEAESRVLPAVHVPLPAGGAGALSAVASLHRQEWRALEGFEKALPPPWRGGEDGVAAIAAPARRAEAAEVLREARGRHELAVEAVDALKPK